MNWPATSIDARAKMVEIPFCFSASIFCEPSNASVENLFVGLSGGIPRVIDQSDAAAREPHFDDAATPSACGFCDCIVVIDAFDGLESRNKA
jgi:hypothetical protein